MGKLRLNRIQDNAVAHAFYHFGFADQKESVTSFLLFAILSSSTGLLHFRFKGNMLAHLNLLALVGLSSLFLTSVLAQEGGLLQPVLPSDLQQCSNITVSWTATPQVAGEDEQYAVRIINSSTAGLELAAEVPLTWLGHFIEETSYSWRVGIPAGTNVTLLITDQAGNRGYSAPVVVRNGSSRCMPEEYAPSYFQGDSQGAASAQSADGMLLTMITGSALLAFAVSFTT